MLNKDQALAAADALILKVEAERRRRLERRTSRWSMLYPAIKLAPLEEREALHLQAEQAPRTRWLVIGSAAVILLALLLAALAPDMKFHRPLALSLALAAASLLGLVRFLCIRAYLQREVPLRYAKSSDP